MSSHVSELKTKILMKIGERVSALGFSKRPVGQSFYAQTPSGRNVIHLGFVPHDDSDVDVIVNLAIRFDSVEDLMNGYRSLSKTQKSSTATVGVELGNLLGIGQKRWNLSTDLDVDRASDDIAETLIAHGIEYFKKGGKLEDVFDILRSFGGEAETLVSIPAVRYEKILAIAAVLHRWDLLPELAESASARLKEAGDLALPRFIAFSSKIMELAPRA
ncbi:hypothetical protein [Inquilinus sp. CA228]|uniref:hypothetical protein n=1 Tax=Inquilinus sp. CA228 TaxID=3455609 RepID=UPI003F8D4FAD